MIKRLLFALLLISNIASSMNITSVIQEGDLENRLRVQRGKLQQLELETVQLAVENDRISFLRQILHNAHGKEKDTIRKFIQKLSVQHKKPHLLILACSQPGMADSMALTEWATQRESLDLEHVDLYYEALEHLQKRASYNKKIIASLKKLPHVLCSMISENIHETDQESSHIMHPSLEKAIKRGDIEKLRECIKKGYSLTAFTADYRDALELATECDQATVFKELIQHLPYIDKQKRKVLLTYTQSDSMKILIEKELPEYIEQQNSKLDPAKVPQMLKLLQSGANPNILHHAFNRYRSDFIPRLKILVRYGLNVANPIDRFGETPIELAMEYEQSDLFELMLKKGANPNTRIRLNCAAHEALSNFMNSTHSIRYLELLLKHGANPNTIDFCSTSLLDRAAQANKEKRKVLIPLLKKYGAKHTWNHIAWDYLPDVAGLITGIVAGTYIMTQSGYSLKNSLLHIAPSTLITSILGRLHRKS